MAFPKIGNLAPAFSLQDQDGNKVSLKQFKGESNVVLYFYPKAMTPGCTVQACGIRDSKKVLAKLDTVVLGVSPDPVPRLGRFIDKQELNFTLLSDERLILSNHLQHSMDSLNHKLHRLLELEYWSMSKPRRSYGNLDITFCP